MDTRPRNRGSISDRGKIFFLFPRRSYRICGSSIHPTSTDFLSQRVISLWRETYYSPSSRAKIKNAWSYTSMVVSGGKADICPFPKIERKIKI
jgi:hypothetical protein